MKREKLEYERPRTTVVELRCSGMLLETSMTREDYGDAVEENWP